MNIRKIIAYLGATIVVGFIIIMIYLTFAGENGGAVPAVLSLMMIAIGGSPILMMAQYWCDCSAPNQAQEVYKA